MREERAKSFLHMIRRSQRGRLKVYLGYGPGVGKTYLMLQEAQRLKKEGVQIVVGIVETHEREDTAKMLEGLEQIPRRQLEYKGIMLEEMDLAAILTRKPEVVLVDELAHTNIPGSSHSKRYEDVKELLGAGIHVIATLNVQHLESLYDTVEKLIGVKVRERIPDSILGEADEVVNVDLTPADLQKRLNEGKVYPRARIGAALENFFQTSNLEHLRELTLREMASQIDFRRREIWDENDKIAPDQIMVCLASKGPHSAQLLRFASRLAGRLNRNWYAVYVQTPSEDPTVIDAATQRLLADTLTLANQLGATVFTFKGRDIVETILKFAKEYRVGHIVIGRPRIPSGWFRVFRRRSIAEKLVERAEGITLVIVNANSTSTENTEQIPATKPTKIRQPVQVQAAGPQSPGVLLSKELKVERILIFKEPVTKNEVLRQLVALIKKSHSRFNTQHALQRLEQREEQGSTFLNEGIALPHARVEKLNTFELALAITKNGLIDVPADHPIEVVLLLLEPESSEPFHLQFLTGAVKIFRNSNFRREIVKINKPKDVLALLQAIEKN